MKKFKVIMGAASFALLMGSVILPLSSVLAQFPLGFFNAPPAWLEYTIYTIGTLPVLIGTGFLFVHAMKVEEELLSEQKEENA